MARAKKRITDEEKQKSRHFRFLLYLDNQEHVAVFENLQKLNKALKIWIKHEPGTDFDPYTGETVETGKEHIHFYVSFPNPVNWYHFCDSIGGDLQFCRPITGPFKNALLYLCHTNTPEKEQYSLASLCGDEVLISDTRKIVQRYLEKDMPLGDAVQMCVLWIKQQEKHIRTEELVFWSVANGCFKGAYNVLTRDCLKEQNTLIEIRKMEYQAVQSVDFAEVSDEEFERMLIDYEDERKGLVNAVYSDARISARGRIERAEKEDSLSQDNDRGQFRDDLSSAAFE